MDTVRVAEAKAEEASRNQKSGVKETKAKMASHGRLEGNACKSTLNVDG